MDKGDKGSLGEFFKSKQEFELNQIENLIRKEIHSFNSIEKFFEKALKEQSIIEYINFLEGLYEKKIIIFVRHAESLYNEWRKKSILNLPFTYKNIPENHDPIITKKGLKKKDFLYSPSKKNEKNKAILKQYFLI